MKSFILISQKKVSILYKNLSSENHSHVTFPTTCNFQWYRKSSHCNSLQ